jgi:Putative Actinobacterial Holin-X, holin superfamily III
MNEPRANQARHHARSEETGERSLAAIAAEVLDELKDFVRTRVEMMRSEVGETVRAASRWLSLGMVACVFLITAYLLFTLALVALVSVTFMTNPYRWFLSFLAVALVWSAAGGIFAYLAWTEYRAQGMLLKKTLDVLKADKVWLENEARSRI